MEMASLFIASVLSEFFGTRKWWRRFFIMVEISWKKVGIRWLYWFIFLSFGAAACCQIAQLCTYTHSIWNHFQENYQLEKRWRYQGLIETLQSFSESVSNGEFHLRDVYAYLGARVDAPSQQTNNKRKCQGYWKLLLFETPLQTLLFTRVRNPFIQKQHFKMFWIQWMLMLRLPLGGLCVGKMEWNNIQHCCLYGDSDFVQYNRFF